MTELSIVRMINPNPNDNDGKNLWVPAGKSIWKNWSRGAVLLTSQNEVLGGDVTLLVWGEQHRQAHRHLPKARVEEGGEKTVEEKRRERRREENRGERN